MVAKHFPMGECSLRDIMSMGHGMPGSHQVHEDGIEAETYYTLIVVIAAFASAYRVSSNPD